jgi:hypothetical protein
VGRNLPQGACVPEVNCLETAEGLKGRDEIGASVISYVVFPAERRLSPSLPQRQKNQEILITISILILIIRLIKDSGGSKAPGPAALCWGAACVREAK